VAEQEPVHYLVAHVRDALAQDPRVSELELKVKIAGSKVFVTGTVPTEERREAVADVVAETLPEFEVQNQTTVESLDGEPGVEHLS
jgi:osmotically-inducible protein OsmY